MTSTVRLELLPQGKVLHLEPGTRLHEILFAEGVEFPCGGKGRCKGCRVRVLEGRLPVTAEDQRLLKPEEVAAGWRLSCQGTVGENLRLELAQWEAAILSDDRVFEFTPAAGLGIAIDLGTTTIVGQLLDLQTANVLAVTSALNTQAKHGADIMSRVEFGVHAEGRTVLTEIVRTQLGAMVAGLVAQGGRGGESLRQVIIVGNTVMHHLFCGVSVEPLAHSPFATDQDGLREFRAAELGWSSLPAAAVVRFLPCLGGFVGSDILAGILATGVHQSERMTALMDLGTNGEIVLGHRKGLLCASTAAGPAFEGARISTGMRATTGAIAAVQWMDGRLECHVLGAGAPRGLCGSGLVDAVACGLEAGRIRPGGRFVAGDSWELVAPVVLAQQDVRELQLAKGAIAAGLRVLALQSETELGAIDRVHLAGAFGNYINRQSARRIGLLQTPLERVVPAGNTALLGAKLALFSPPETDFTFAALRRTVRHISLHEDPRFHDVYVEEMRFPG